MIDAGLIKSSERASWMNLGQELAQRGQNVADFFWGGGRVPIDPRETSQRVVCQNKTLARWSAPQIHTHIGSDRMSGHGEGRKEKNGFPVLHEVAAANMKLTAAM